MKQLLTQERLNTINANNERNDKMFMIEMYGFKEMRSGLVRDNDDWCYAQYDSLEEAKAHLDKAVKHAELEYEYYEVYISQAFTWNDSDEADIEYEQLDEYTIKNCEPASNKMEAYYI